MGCVSEVGVLLSCIFSALFLVGKEVPGKTCRRHQGGHSLQKAHWHNRNVLLLVTSLWSLWLPPAGPFAAWTPQVPAPVGCTTVG